MPTKRRYEHDPDAVKKAVAMVIDDGKTLPEASAATGVRLSSLPALIGVEKNRQRKELGMTLPSQRELRQKRSAKQLNARFIAYLESDVIGEYAHEDDATRIALESAGPARYLHDELRAFFAEPLDVREAILILHVCGNPRIVGEDGPKS